MKKNRVDTRAIVMLLFALVTVVVIMLQLRRTMPQPPAELARLTGRVGVVDSTLIHLPLSFMLRMPGSDWRPEILSSDTLFAPVENDRTLWEQITWLAEMSPAQNDSVVAKLGLLEFAEKPATHELGISLLAELLASFETGGQRVDILQQVTGPAHPVLKGDYFVIKSPAKPGEEALVLAVALLPRGNYVFIIHGQTPEPLYSRVREELQELITRFYALPSRF